MILPPYGGQHEGWVPAGLQQSQMFSSSLFNGNQLVSNATLPSTNQESGAAIAVNHNIDAVANGLVGICNTTVPNQQWYNRSNAGATTTDELKCQSLHMNSMMAIGGHSSACTTDKQQQVMGSLNLLQNHHQISGGRGLPAVPNSLPISHMQNITSNADSSASQIPGHIKFQLPSFQQGTTNSFQTAAGYSEVLGNVSTGVVTTSQEIEKIRKENDLLVQLTNNHLHQQSILSRQHRPQHLTTGIDIVSTPAKSALQELSNPNNEFKPK